MVLYAAAAVAQQPDLDQKDTAGRSLAEVVITAQRQERQAMQLPATVHAVPKRQLAESASRSVPEALMGVNGVFIQKQIMVVVHPLYVGLPVTRCWYW